VTPDLFVGYAMAQALAIVVFVLVPTAGWSHVVWQVTIGGAGAVFVVVGVRRARLAGALPWYLFGASTLLCASGVLVEALLDRFFGITASPNLADLFWLALYPGLLGGLASLVYRRSAGQSAGAIMGSTLMSALFTIGVGLFAWESIVWRTGDQSVDLLKRLIVTAYPLGDLAVLAFVLRLLFAAGARSLAFGLIVLSIACHLAADIAWAYFLRSGTEPEPGVRQILEATSLAAHALMGAAALHRSMREVALPAPGAGEQPRTSPVAWVALAVSASAAPALVALEAILDRLYHVTGN
jgi:hypothetical protein